MTTHVQIVFANVFDRSIGIKLILDVFQPLSNPLHLGHLFLLQPIDELLPQTLLVQVFVQNGRRGRRQFLGLFGRRLQQDRFEVFDFLAFTRHNLTFKVQI